VARSRAADLLGMTAEELAAAIPGFAGALAWPEQPADAPGTDRP